MSYDLMQVASPMELIALAVVGDRAEINRDRTNARIDCLSPALVGRQGLDKDILVVQIIVKAALVLELGEQRKEIYRDLGDGGGCDLCRSRQVLRQAGSLDEVEDCHMAR